MHRYSGFGEIVEDISVATTTKQNVATDMRNRTLLGVDSDPSLPAGIKGGQLRSRQFRSEVR
jgi:hypothetical protein